MNTNLWYVKFRIVLVLITSLLAACTCLAQEGDSLKQEERSLQHKRWFIALPLRFTQLQNSNTMLSGIKVGKNYYDKLNLSLSIYHSFYLKSFKAEANLVEFDEQPRLFINATGIDLEPVLIQARQWSLGFQLFTGWTFLTYDLDEYNFECERTNFLSLEPALNLKYAVNNTTHLALGMGYRSLFGKDTISYHSDISQGTIPVHTLFPNGFTILLTLKGYL